MKFKASLRLIPGVLLGLTLAGPVFAQSASESMHQAGHDTGNALSNAWHGTKTAVKDTDITAKVKMELHSDKLTKGQDIHVKTVEGIVTLSGHAPAAVANRAVHVARETTGVVGVNNDLRVSDTMSAR
jgi:hyperosmotically inducible periplasmic protein